MVDGPRSIGNAPLEPRMGAHGVGRLEDIQID